MPSPIAQLLVSIAVSALQPPEDAPPPESPPPSNARPSGRDAALDAAYGTPPADVGPDPRTRENPGFTDEPRKTNGDKTHTSTRRSTNPDGTVTDGLTIYDDEELGGDTQEPVDVPDVHVVQSGDTLWDISGTYLNDPYLWPKLWSWNEHVTNAHWIFPGDRIRLYDPKGDGGRRGDGGDGGGDGSGDGTGTGDGTGDGGYRYGKTRVPEEALQEQYVLNQTTFVDAKQFETSMKVIGGGEANVLMSTHDTIYMSYEKKHPPVPGERLVAYAPLEKVYDLKDRKVLGYIVQIVGEVDVESIAPKAAEGTVAFSLHPVERGYRVGPLRRTFKRVDTKKSEKAKAGVIVATINEAGPMGLKNKRRRKSLLGDHVLVGEVQFVVMDLGRQSGVQTGNVLEVVRKGDEYTKKRVFKIPYEKCWPRRVIGAVLVLQVNEDTSFGAAVYTRREIERGDHVELVGRKPPEDEKCDEDDKKKSKRQKRREAEAEADASAEDGKADATFTIGGGK